MEALKEIIKLGFTVRLDDKDKIWFKYKNRGGYPPDYARVKQLVREIRENRDIAVQEIKKIKSAEVLNSLLLPNNNRAKISYVRDYN